MAASAFFAVLGSRWWASQMTFEGWAVLVLAIAVFVASGLWSYFMSRPHAPETPWRPQACYEISWRWAAFFSVFAAIMAYYSVQAMYEASVILGNTGGYGSMIHVVRGAIERDDFGGLFNRWMNYRAMAAQMIACAYLCLFLYDVILVGWRWRFLAALPPVLCYIPFLILSTGRMTMLCFVIYAFVVAAILFLRKHGYDVRARRHILGYAVLAGAAFMLFFFLMGLLTGKTGGDGRSYPQIIAHYAGLSLPAFGEVVTYPTMEDGLIGSHTLGPVYRVLTSIGFSLPPVKNFMPFTDFSGIDTNVYTVLWRYTWDYGIVGMLLLMFLIGAGYTLLYRYLRHARPHPYALMAYAMFVYPIFWFPMDDRLLMEVWNTTTVYDLVILFALYELLFVHSRKTPIPPHDPSTSS